MICKYYLPFLRLTFHFVDGSFAVCTAPFCLKNITLFPTILKFVFFFFFCFFQMTQNIPLHNAFEPALWHDILVFFPSFVLQKKCISFLKQCSGVTRSPSDLAANSKAAELVPSLNHPGKVTWTQGQLSS